MKFHTHRSTLKDIDYIVMNRLVGSTQMPRILGTVNVWIP